jgi:hypothetical protein
VQEEETSIQSLGFIMGELLLLPIVRIKDMSFLRLLYFNFQHLLLVAYEIKLIHNTEPISILAEPILSCYIKLFLITKQTDIRTILQAFRIKEF